MKIKDIKINHFGNLENKEIYLDNKINIIYGKNESGKSTLLNYIKTMFYGISKNKNGKDISDYEKYKPWMKEDFSGKLKYELDNGKIFEIFRDFNKKNPKIFNENLEEISKEFNIDKKDGVQFFYEQTNVDEMMFLSTVVSMQQEVKLNKQEQNILVQKIANLAGTGDDNISFQKILDKLTKKQVDEVGTDRTQEKPINVVKKRMKELLLVIKDIKLLQEEKEKNQREKEELISKIKELEFKSNILNKIEELNIEKNIEQEKINLKNKIKNNHKEKINQLKIEKNNLMENKEKIRLKNENKNEGKINSRSKIKNNKLENKNKKIKDFIFLFFILLLSIALKIINTNYIKNSILEYMVYIIPMIAILFIFIKYFVDKSKINKIEREENLKQELERQRIELENEKNKNEIIILEKQIENIDQQIKELNEEMIKQEEEIRNLQNYIDEKIDFTIEKIKEENKHVDVEAILEQINFKNAKQELIDVQEQLGNLRISLNTIENREKDILDKLENAITLNEEYQSLEEELKQLEEKNMQIQLTKEYLSRAYEKMKNTVTPKFTENLSHNIEEISNHKYTKVTVHDEKGIVVENQYGEYIPANRLSIGTIDQLYLSLRLSMIDDISNESMPIILDEAFAYYDESRLQNILTFLNNRANKNQVIIFTCTRREQEILDKVGFAYNLVEL